MELYNDGDFEELQETVRDLQKEIVLLRQTLEFWMGEVPIKYKKIFPKEGEYPFFRLPKFKEEKKEEMPVNAEELREKTKSFRELMNKHGPDCGTKTTYVSAPKEPDVKPMI